jgi:hypothetical protein
MGGIAMRAKRPGALRDVRQHLLIVAALAASMVARDDPGSGRFDGVPDLRLAFPAPSGVADPEPATCPNRRASEVRRDDERP